jgi:HEAT repeat protein
VRRNTNWILILVPIACLGCGGNKSTAELVQDAKSANEMNKIKAVRQLGDQQRDAEQTVPVLIESLKDKSVNVRRSAALGLGEFGDRAKDAVPALQAAQSDQDARVREAAGIALSRIDPSKFSPPSSKSKPGRGK